MQECDHGTFVQKLSFELVISVSGYLNSSRGLQSRDYKLFFFCSLRGNVMRRMSSAYKLFLCPCESLGRIVLPLEAGCKGVLKNS